MLHDLEGDDGIEALVDKGEIGQVLMTNPMTARAASLGSVTEIFASQGIGKPRLEPAIQRADLLGEVDLTARLSLTSPH